MKGAVGPALRTLSAAPWRRAPRVLLRRPGVLASVAGAVAVLVASVAGAPLFLSSAGTAAVAAQADERCPRDTGATYAFTASPQELDPLTRDEASDPFAPLADELGPTVLWMQQRALLTPPADETRSTPVVLLARDGSLDHVDILEGSPGPGVWITDRAAAETGLGAGDRAIFEPDVEVPIAGVYQDLAGHQLDDYWCPHDHRHDERRREHGGHGPEDRPPDRRRLEDA